MHGMDLGAQAGLLAAAANLKVVTSLVTAMRRADKAIAAERLKALRGEPIFEPRPHIHPTPEFEPRPVIHPTTRFEPRLTIHPQTRVDDRPACDDPGKANARHLAALLPPPWKMPVWKNPITPAPKIKVIQHRTEVVNKGSLVDLFL
jgi:hypothetical protein